MATITKKDLVNRIAASTNQTKMVTKEVIQRFLDEIVRELGSGNRLEFREFGVFEIKQRAARKARNPRTRQDVRVPPRKVVKFKVGRAMRDAVERLVAAEMERAQQGLGGTRAAAPGEGPGSAGNERNAS